MKTIDLLVTVPFNLAPTEGHHPISRGQSPKFYRPGDLTDSGTGEGTFVLNFERYLLAMFWALGCPVPYAFRTLDGKVRHLDAGCIKWMLNRSPAEIVVHCDADGYIGAVQPFELLLDRYCLYKDEICHSLLI